jgi:hypothetical protein
MRVAMLSLCSAADVAGEDVVVEQARYDLLGGQAFRERDQVLCNGRWRNLSSPNPWLHLPRPSRSLFPLFKREDGAAVGVVDDRDVEPGPLLEQLQVAVAVGISTSARIAISGLWPGPGVTVSVRQIAEPTKRFLPFASFGSSS